MNKSNIDVWVLVIEYSGSRDKKIHRSIHVSPHSARNVADMRLGYDVPEFEEWYERPATDKYETSRFGYVLDRDEIDSWPIRIEATKESVLEQT